VDECKPLPLRSASSALYRSAPAAVSGLGRAVKECDRWCEWEAAVVEEGAAVEGRRVC
jgi:hypothetical protein